MVKLHQFTQLRISDMYSVAIGMENEEHKPEQILHNGQYLHTWAYSIKIITITVAMHVYL